MQISKLKLAAIVNETGCSLQPDKMDLQDICYIQVLGCFLSSL